MPFMYRTTVAQLHLTQPRVDQTISPNMSTAWSGSFMVNSGSKRSDVYQEMLKWSEIRCQCGVFAYATAVLETVVTGSSLDGFQSLHA